MKKTLFNIDDSEKKRILEMHQNATNKLYLNEQENINPITDTSKLKTLYNSVSKRTWPLIQNAIVINGVSNGTPNGIMSWTYPIGTKDITNLYFDHDQDSSTANILDKTKLSSYDAEFLKRLEMALNDDKWLTDRANEANIENKAFKNEIIPFQTYLMNNINDKSLVKDNGSGGPFNDGVFYKTTLRAFIKYKMQSLNNEDSRYLIVNHLI